MYGKTFPPQPRRYRCGSVNRSQASSRRGGKTVSGNERTMRSAITLGLGILIAAATPGLRAQVNPSTPNSVKSALGNAGQSAQQAAKPAAQAAGNPAPQAATKPAVPAATKPAPQAAKPTGKPAVKPSGKPGAKRATKPAAKPTVRAVEKRATPGTAPAAAESEVKQARRDPFESLIGRQKDAPKNLPPGK